VVRVTRAVAEIAAALRELAYRLEDLDDGSALPPLFVHVGVQVPAATVTSEAARMALVDRVAGALGLDAALTAGGQYSASSPLADLSVYTAAPVAAASAVVAAAEVSA
jgi:hypothetical protein